MGGKSELEKMLAGELYFGMDEQLVEMRNRCYHLVREYCDTMPEEGERRRELLCEIFGYKTDAMIAPPFYCEFGPHIQLGQGVFFNYNCVILDCNRVEIGDRTLFGPDVKIITATHPISPKERLVGHEYALPVKIGKNVWIGAGVTINPGVSIGDNSVIGSGSVVTKDIPANVVAVGVPARVMKTLGE